MNYDEIYLEGYYDALNEGEFWDKYKKKIIGGLALTGAAAGGVHLKRKSDRKAGVKELANMAKEAGRLNPKTAKIGLYDKKK